MSVSTDSTQRPLPVFTNLKDQTVLVVGGGRAAARRVKMLLDSGAQVRVVAEEVVPALSELSHRQDVELEQRTFLPEDLEGALLALVVDVSLEEARRIFRYCQASATLVNAIDRPECSNFAFGALAQSGPVQVAVSSSGCSPTIAKRVRDQIQETCLPPWIGRLASLLGGLRGRMNSFFLDYDQRKGFWEAILRSRVPSLVQEGREDEAREELLRVAGQDDFAKGGKMPDAGAQTGSDDSHSVADPVDQGLALLRAKSGRQDGHCAHAKPLHPTPHQGKPSEATPSKVFLVGAGPGAAELLTLRALRTIREAQVVLYDRLVGPEVMELVPEDAERIYVGKSFRRDADEQQNSIMEVMVARAKAGLRVVRLKGGDPFVFGRGGEEVLALAQAGIEAQVVPGVSSCFAAPALAGIPVTMRGAASSVSVFAGQLRQEGGEEVSLDWAAAAHSPTSVFLMGVSRLTQIADRLIEHGRDAKTPIAIVESASHPNQGLRVSTLGQVRQIANSVSSPATIIVGEVANFPGQIQALVKAGGREPRLEQIEEAQASCPAGDEFTNGVSPGV